MALTKNERSQRAAIASYTSWLNTENRTARTQPGRDAMNRKFEDQVDPERKLPAAERAKLVEAARKLYFHRLAFASAKARRQRNEARKSA